MANKTKNPKKKTKPAPQKQTTQRRILNTTSSMNGPAKLALTRQVCAITDPFCKHAIGAKLPDNSSVRTLTYSRHVQTTLATDVSGRGGLLILPNYNYWPFVETSVGVGGFGVPVAMTPSIPFSNTALYRIVSCGVKISSVAAPLNASGLVRIRSFNDSNGAGYNPINYSSFATPDYIDIPLRETNGIAVVSVPLPMPRQSFYDPLTTTPSSDATHWQAPGFGAIGVSLMGGPVSTDVIVVELFLNMEIVFEEGNSMALLASPPPPANQALVNASSKLTSLSTFVFDKGISAASSWIERKAMAAIGAYFTKSPSSLALLVD